MLVYVVYSAPVKGVMVDYEDRVVEAPGGSLHLQLVHSFGAGQTWARLSASNPGWEYVQQYLIEATAGGEKAEIEIAFRSPWKETLPGSFSDQFTVRNAHGYFESVVVEVRRTTSILLEGCKAVPAAPRQAWNGQLAELYSFVRMPIMRNPVRKQQLVDDFAHGLILRTARLGENC